MTRRPASDSKASAREVMAKATMTIICPPHIHLNEAAEYYFAEIIMERANADWAGHDISVAAKLARLMAREDVLSELLDDEGPTVEGAQGGVTKNPTATVLSDTTGKIVALRRSLCLHASGKNPGLKLAQVGKARGQRKAIQDVGDAGDPLLAGPRG